MRKYGLCYAFDPRVNYKDNDRFQDLMQAYFALRSKQYYQGEKGIDVCDNEIPLGLKYIYNEKLPPFKEEK